VSYQPGFTNLSLFSRVFAEHTGIKPKTTFSRIVQRLLGAREKQRCLSV